MPKPAPFSQSLREWMDIFMHRSMRGWKQFAKSAGLSMPQFSILMQLHHQGAFGMSEVSERFEITPAAASQLVDKLVQSGLVQREEDPDDRRAKVIQLAPKGKDLVETGIRERYRWLDEIASKLSAEEKLRAAESLKVLTEAAKQLEEKV